MSQAVAFGAKRGTDDKPGPARIPKAARVKNKNPAAIQITAEQILQEVTDRQLEKGAPPPKQPIRNEEELRDYKMRKRKTFEDNIRKNRGVISNWIKYAEWEAGQKEIKRAESVFERALDQDHRNIGLWLKYAEMEMKNGQVSWTLNKILLCYYSYVRVSRLTMLVICGTEGCSYCLELTSSGSNTLTWRRCLERSGKLDRCLRGGWSGNRWSRPGSLI